MPDRSPVVVWSPDTIPPADDPRWEVWVKRPLPIRMVPIKGPCRFVTIDGSWTDLPADWEGYVAIDSEGYPYPLHRDVHAKSYVRDALEAPESHADARKGV